MNLRDSVVVLTGASRGIGVAIACDLAKEGARLVLTARDEAGLKSVAEQVRQAGGEAHIVAGDVASASDRERIIAAARALGPIAALVNNAGIENTLAVVDQKPEQIEKQLAVNLAAPILLTRAVLPDMIARREGAIVMVSSMSGKSPTPYNSVYSATKFGMNGFTASLRIELKGTGVTTGVVCPSFVADAGMWADTGAQAPAMLREVPLARVVAGVRAVLDGAGEVLVTPNPVKPLLALGQLAPELSGWMLKRLGVLETLRARAKTNRDDR